MLRLCEAGPYLGGIGFMSEVCSPQLDRLGKRQRWEEWKDNNQGMRLGISRVELRATTGSVYIQKEVL